LSAKPGRKNELGLVDYGVPAVQALAAINFPKTFGEDKEDSTKCVDAHGDISKIVDGLFGALQKTGELISALIDEIVKGFMWVINKISNLFSLVDGFLLKLLNCLFPPVGLTIKPVAAVDDLLGMIEAALKPFQTFFNLFSDLLNILAPIACMKASLADLAPSITNQIPGLSCLLGLFSVDICLRLSLDVGRLAADLAFAAIAEALRDISMLLARLFAFKLGFPKEFEAQNCLPAQAAILMVKLGLRTAIATAGVPL
jgi:hypothetical protein